MVLKKKKRTAIGKMAMEKEFSKIFSSSIF
ncbi:hypothetical protein ABIA69_002650 [Lysinibacillus parviboronicapiens]|uniref:Transposase n=1 Tax=Lysinibacillus parviboronicapiens TaxID=436516 RepID=A0ABV2PKK8_9BACI